MYEINSIKEYVGIEKLLKWKLLNKKYTEKVSVNISEKRIYFWKKNGLNSA